MSALKSTRSSVRYAIVPGFSRYRAGTDGSVWSKTWKTKHEWTRMKAIFSPSDPSKPEFGYYRVGMTSDAGKRVKWTVQRVILTTFVGPRGRHQQCRHLDRDTSNNDLSNIVWGTVDQNIQDKKDHGTFFVPPPLRGSSNFHAKLSEDSIPAVFAMKASGIPGTRIAKTLGVSSTVIYRILSGDGWRT